MKRSMSLLLLIVGILFVTPMIASAQDASPAADTATEDATPPVLTASIIDDENSFLFKVKGDIAIPAGDSIQTAIVIKGNATIDGTVEDALVVTKGDATIRGTVEGTIVVVKGTLNLESGSSVGDITLIDGTLNRAENATVAGEIDTRGYDFSIGRGAAVFSLLWWLGSTIVALVAAALFAWFGRTQLFGSVDILRGEFVKSLITAVVMWILLPLGATLIVFTLIGAPLGISIWLVVMPLLWLIGVIVVGAWLGSYIIKPTDTYQAVGAALVGTLILSLIALIPFVAIIVGLAGSLGAGAFVYRLIHHQNTPVTSGYSPATF